MVVVTSNKPNPAQIMEKLNNIDGSHACESCYGMYACFARKYCFCGISMINNHCIALKYVHVNSHLWMFCLSQHSLSCIMAE